MACSTVWYYIHDLKLGAQLNLGTKHNAFRLQSDAPNFVPAKCPVWTQEGKTRRHC
jgi:hypothetical protein